MIQGKNPTDFGSRRFSRANPAPAILILPENYLR
jgi:hypothetical protein